MKRLESDGGRLSRRALAIVGVGLFALALGVSSEASAAAEPLALSLDDAVGMALERSREVAMARAGADAADARLRQARARFFPAIGVSGSYTRLDEAPYMNASQFGNVFEPLLVPFMELVDNGYLSEAALAGLASDGGGRIYVGDDDIYSLGVSVRQPLFTGGAILSAHGAAKHGALAGTLNAERAEHEVRFDVTERYVGLVRAKAALDVMEDMVRQVRSHLSDVEALYDEGMVVESDLMLARIRMSEVELGRARAGHLARIAGTALSFALGIDLDTEIEPLDDLRASALPDGGATDWTRRAVERRPDLAAANELVGAAGNAVSMARAGYLPSVVLIGDYSWDRPNREYEPEFYGHWSVTAALEMSLFDWGLTGGRVNEAKAGLIQAEKARELFEDAVRLEVAQSSMMLDEALDELEIAEQSMIQAREGMRVVREGFANGFATSSDVLDAQTALTTAEMNRIAALAGLRVAEARLGLAMGETNQWRGQRE
jgi:outer membrane protein